MTIDCRLAQTSDSALFERIAEGVFDRPIKPRLLSEFLREPRHHIAIAREGGSIVGFVSAVDYVHPDKPRQLWINEVGVAPTHRHREELVQLMIERARALGCTEAWVLTDADNEPANRLYRSTGAAPQRSQRMYVYRLS